MKDSPTKKICFFNSSNAWGESEKWQLMACKELQRKGFKTILVASMYSQLAVKGIQEKQDVYRFRIGKLSFLNPFKIFVFFLFFKLKKIDALVLNSPADVRLAASAAKLAGVSKVIYKENKEEINLEELIKV